MTKNEFNIYLEELKTQNEFETYIETLVYYYDNETDLEFSEIVKLLNRRIIGFITKEAEQSLAVKSIKMAEFS